MEVTKERVLAAANKCPDAKKVLEELFPEVFFKPRELKIGDHFFIERTAGIFVLALTGNKPTSIPAIRLINIETGRKYQEDPIRYNLTCDKKIILLDRELDRQLTPIIIYIQTQDKL